MSDTARYRSIAVSMLRHGWSAGRGDHLVDQGWRLARPVAEAERGGQLVRGGLGRGLGAGPDLAGAVARGDPLPRRPAPGPAATSPPPSASPPASQPARGAATSTLTGACGSRDRSSSTLG